MQSATAAMKGVSGHVARPTLGGHDEPSLTLKWELISPAKAEAYLSLNFDRNRSVRKNWVAYLANQMANGQFKATHQGIAFDEQGFLIDGQHRLSAIVVSGTSQWMMVARNAPRDSVLGMDIHARRDASDRIRVAFDGLNPTKSRVAIARAMLAGNKTAGPQNRVDGDALAEFLVRHADALDFAAPVSTARATTASPLRAAIARAWYHVDRDRLKEFVDVIDNGLANGPEDSAAVRLRDIVLRGGYTGSSSNRAELFRKTCYAIQAFVGRTPVAKIFAVQGNLYPLPEEVEAARLRDLRDASGE